MSTGAPHHRLLPALVSLAALSGCASSEPPRQVSYAEARGVVNRRCVECHSEHPANRAFPIAPKGVKLDTALEMKQHAPRIAVRVEDGTMPIANMSAMTAEERSVLTWWVRTGAQIQNAGRGAPPGTVPVSVNMVGFDPPSIEVKAGEAVKLAFLRTSPLQCTREVVFPGLGIRRELPAGEFEVIEIKTEKKGSIAFECGMKMLKGQLVVR